MKRLIAILFLLSVSLTGWAANPNVVFRLSDFGQGAAANGQFIISNTTAFTLGGTEPIITQKPRIVMLNTSGTLTVSNMAPITYRILYPPTPPFYANFLITVPDTSATLNAADLTSVSTNNSSVNSAYSIASSDARFVRKNGSPTNTQVLTYNAATGLFWPSNSVGGVQTNAFPTASATTKSGSTNSFIGGGESNSIAGAWALIMGGRGNSNSANFGFVGGGQNNTNRPGSTQGGAIVAGFDNSNESWQGFIGAGNHNVLMAAEFATIVGGSQNIIASGQASVITAGQDNYIESEWGFIGGGETNRIELGVDYATIVGGIHNLIGGPGGTQAGQYGFIGGGIGNIVHDDASSIAGGQGNTIEGGSGNSGILGGRSNFLAATESFIVGSRLTNTLASSVDLGGSDSTKATISTTGSVFRTALTAPSVTSAASVTGTNFVATGVTASRAAAFDSLKGLISATASLVELNFLSGVTAGIQQQFVDGTNNVAGLRTAFQSSTNVLLHTNTLRAGNGITLTNGGIAAIDIAVSPFSFLDDPFRQRNQIWSWSGATAGALVSMGQANTAVGGSSIGVGSTNYGPFGVLTNAATAFDVASFSDTLVGSMLFQKPIFRIRFQLLNTNAVGIFVAGMTTATASQMTTNQPVTTTFFELRASATAPDANFKVVNSNGDGNYTTLDTGVAIDANIHTCDLYYCRFASSNLVVAMDGVFVGTNTSNLPGLNAQVRTFVATKTLEAAAKTNRVFTVEVLFNP